QGAADNGGEFSVGEILGRIGRTSGLGLDENRPVHLVPLGASDRISLHRRLLCCWDQQGGLGVADRTVRSPVRRAASSAIHKTPAGGPGPEVCARPVAVPARRPLTARHSAPYAR